MQITYSREIEVKYETDVFVAGGGPAGVAAAVTCARAGRSVFLAESYSAFGGAAVTMLVPAFMSFGNGTQFLADGIGREIRDKIAQETGKRWRKYCPDSIPAETLKRIYDDMVMDAGVKFQFHTTLTDAIVEDGKIRYVVCAAKGQTFAVKARVYIDCTGDGELSQMAGAECAFGDEEGRTMAATLCGLWSGINWSRVQGPDRRRLEDAFTDNVFTNIDRHLPGMWRLAAETVDENGIHRPDGIGGSNAGHVYGIDAQDAASLTEGIICGREQLLEYQKYYREYLTGYETMELVSTAAHLGIRESRRIRGDYCLVLDDFKNRAVFDDEIGRYNYPVDIHSQQTTVRAIINS